MTSKTALKRVKAIARLPLDLPMAALAAASVAFVAYAMPDDVFGQAVGMSGLPSFVPAAQPPLGGTARLAVIVAGAAATFGLVWLLLRALSRPRPADAPAAELPDFDVAPRLRRADAHPDAPSRRPLFAGLDLGEPSPGTDELELVERLNAETEEPLPEIEAEAGADNESDAELDRDDEVAPMFRVPEALPEPPNEMTFEPAPEPGPAAEAQFEPAPEFEAAPPMEAAPIRVEMRTDSELEIEAAEEAVPAPEAPRIRIEAVAPAPVRDPAPEASISSLMQRLERGLERRSAPVPQPVPAAAAGATDTRLRSALGDLQKIAQRKPGRPRPSAPRS